MITGGQNARSADAGNIYDGQKSDFPQANNQSMGAPSFFRKNSAGPDF